MLRVLQVIGKMNRAGAESMLMNLYRHIDRTKVQFDFLVFADSKADYDLEIEALGGHIYRLSPFKGYNYFTIRKEVRRFFQSHTYEIVHGHIGSLAPMYLKIAKEHGSFAVAHSHNTNPASFLTRLGYNALACRVRYIADYFFACSLQAGIDRFGQKVVNGDSFSVFNNAIDSTAFCYTPARNLAQKEKYGFAGKTVYGHVGRFAVQKNHAFLLDIFSEIHKRQPDSVLLLAGTGPEEENIRKKAELMHLADCIEFLGVREDIPDLMNLFDVFIFPSFYEGLSVCAIEAQAAGLPCFFSDGLVSETIITKNAWRYSLQDSADVWAENILRETETFQRTDTQQDVIRAQFDICSTAEALQTFYLEHAEKHGI